MQRAHVSGPSEVLSRVGAGATGEVWKARDTRLDRSVAIKILPAALAKDAQFKLRFEREAKTMSHLNHPHALRRQRRLSGHGTARGRDPRGSCGARSPLADVLRYGAQIAEALHRVHRGNVVHRDLENASDFDLTRDGRVLIVEAPDPSSAPGQLNVVVNWFEEIRRRNPSLP